MSESTDAEDEKSKDIGNQQEPALSRGSATEAFQVTSMNVLQLIAIIHAAFKDIKQFLGWVCDLGRDSSGYWRWGSGLRKLDQEVRDLHELFDLRVTGILLPLHKRPEGPESLLEALTSSRLEYATLNDEAREFLTRTSYEGYDTLFDSLARLYSTLADLCINLQLPNPHDVRQRTPPALSFAN